MNSKCAIRELTHAEKVLLQICDKLIKSYDLKQNAENDKIDNSNKISNDQSSTSNIKNAPCRRERTDGGREKRYETEALEMKDPQEQCIIKEEHEDQEKSTGRDNKSNVNDKISKNDILPEILKEAAVNGDKVHFISGNMNSIPNIDTALKHRKSFATTPPALNTKCNCFVRSKHYIAETSDAIVKTSSGSNVKNKENENLERDNSLNYKNKISNNPNTKTSKTNQSVIGTEIPDEKLTAIIENALLKRDYKNSIEFEIKTRRMQKLCQNFKERNSASRKFTEFHEASTQTASLASVALYSSCNQYRPEGGTNSSKNTQESTPSQLKNKHSELSIRTIFRRPVVSSTSLETLETSTSWNSDQLSDSVDTMSSVKSIERLIYTKPTVAEALYVDVLLADAYELQDVIELLTESIQE